MQIEIRRATEEDYNGLNPLFDELDALHREKLPHVFHKPDGPPRAQEYYRRLLADERVGLFVAQAADGEIVGFVHVVVEEAPSIPIFVPRRLAVVDSIAVSSAHRGEGIGSMLMNRAEGWAASRGATTIDLNVYEFNTTAIDFYTGLGYTSERRHMSKHLPQGGADEASGN